MRQFAQNVTQHRFFEPFIIACILLNGLVLGLETSVSVMAGYGHLLSLTNNVILGVFIVEAALKITAVAPRIGRYFGDGWNLFDFSVVVFSLIPATGELAMVARLARLLRVLRLISAIPELRLIVNTLVRSLPSMGHVLMLMGIIFYIYAIAGYHLFHEHDPVHWRSLGMSLLTLFRVVTLEDWTDVMYAAMEMNAYSWIYFVSFVVCGTFVVINLFIAVVLNNLEEAKLENLQSMAPSMSKEDVVRELQKTQEMLHRMQVSIQAVAESEKKSD